MTLARPLVLATVLLVLAACGGTEEVVLGRRIATEHLADLTVGASTEGDVDRALGKPTGLGMARWPGELRAIDLRVYDFQRMKSSEADLNILIVFIKDGTYVGHYWFGSGT